MLKTILLVCALSAVSILAVAGESDAREAAKQVIELQDGSVLYVFKSGKMAVESKYGNAVSTKAGSVLKAKDGSTITMTGNETAYLSTLLYEGQEN